MSLAVWVLECLFATPRREIDDSLYSPQTLSMLSEFMSSCKEDEPEFKECILKGIHVILHELFKTPALRSIEVINELKGTL